MEHLHDCDCGHDHAHEHDETLDYPRKDKYHESFDKFEPVGSDEQITTTVTALLDKEARKNFTPDVLKHLHGCIDLTSLTSLDSKESIWKMVESVNDYEGTRPDVPNVAAICVYPLFAETVKQALRADDVRIATVCGGFPASQTFSEIKVAETAMAVMEGAEEIDTVMNLAKRCNKYIDETAPWVLAKDESRKSELETVLYNLLECIRLLANLLAPIMPESAEAIKSQLCCDNAVLSFGEVKEYSVGAATPLFARIDAEKVLAEIAAEQKAEKENEKAENTITAAQIGIEDFAKVELKAAKILKCEPVPKAKKLLKLTLDDGSGKERTVASGIAKYYKPEELIGHTVVLVSNLKPATLCGVESNGMILAADCADDDVKVLFIDNVPAGSKIR